MRRTTLLALSFMFAAAWSHDSARAQSSASPPVSIAPPDASPPLARARNSRTPPAASGRETSPPVIGGLPSAPNPAADYDGFSVGADGDNDAPSQVTPTARSRAAKGFRSNADTGGQSSIDQDDEALKRRLTICRDCK